VKSENNVRIKKRQELKETYTPATNLNSKPDSSSAEKRYISNVFSTLMLAISDVKKFRKEA
jgi:hypothetical protein